MDLDQIEKQQLRDFLVSVYGPVATAWPMNDVIFDLTYALLDESRQCSDLMDLIPRPMPIGQQPAKWLSRQTRRLILRQLHERKRHYTVCVKVSAWKRRIDFDSAANNF